MTRKRLGKAIGARRAYHLIRQIGGMPDRKLAAEWEYAMGHPLSRPDEDIVRLEDGRVLSISYASANLFASEDEYRRLLEHCRQVGRRKPGHSLGKKFPKGQGFIEAVPALVQELPARLNLAPQVLNGTVESLEHIDKCARLLEVDLVDDPTFLAPIVAYVGEVLRRATDGHWEIRDLKVYGADESSQWEPTIVGANGRGYHTFLIFKELLERGSIHAVITFELAGRHMY